MGFLAALPTLIPAAQQGAESSNKANNGPEPAAQPASGGGGNLNYAEMLEKLRQQRLMMLRQRTQTSMNIQPTQNQVMTQNPMMAQYPNNGLNPGMNIFGPNAGTPNYVPTQNNPYAQPYARPPQGVI